MKTPRTAILVPVLLASCKPAVTPPQTVAPEPTPEVVDEAEAATEPALKVAVTRRRLGHSGAYACRRDNGALQCWGKSIVLPGGDSASPTGVMTMPVENVRDFAVGSDRICALQRSRVVCWGHDDESYLPPLAEVSPGGFVDPIEVVAGPVDPVKVEIQDSNVCVLGESGALTCWRLREPTDLEYDEAGDDEELFDVMVRHDMSRGAIAFAMGSAFVCAIEQTGEVLCWGEDPQHLERLDQQWDVCVDAIYDDDCDADVDPDCEYTEEAELECDRAYDEALDVAWETPRAIKGIPEPVSLAAGLEFACAQTKEGSVYCWGIGTSGQLGNGAATDSQRPVRAMGLEDSTALAALSETMCSIHADGTVSCWGGNQWGHVAPSGDHIVVRPTARPGLKDVTGLETGGDLACALTGPDDDAVCWGRDSHGLVGGDRRVDDYLDPVATGVDDVFAADTSTCVRRGKSLSCWGGMSPPAQRGLFARMKPKTVRQPEVSRFKGPGSCVLGVKKDARCWSNWQEFGRGGPSRVVVTEAVDVSAGHSHRCAATRGGHIYCWRGKDPIEVVNGLRDAVGVATASKVVCAVRKDGLVDCTNPDAGTKTPPTRIARVTGVQELVAGQSEFCSRDKAGTVHCWSASKLEDIPLEHSVPKVSALVAGDRHFCGIVPGGEVYCWGSNYHGTVNPRAQTGTLPPTALEGLRDVVSLAAGSQHTCARTKKGDVHCWGYGTLGQLGRPPGTIVPDPTPLRVD